MLNTGEQFCNMNTIVCWMCCNLQKPRFIKIFVYFMRLLFSSLRLSSFLFCCNCTDGGVADRFRAIWSGVDHCDKFRTVLDLSKPAIMVVQFSVYTWWRPSIFWPKVLLRKRIFSLSMWWFSFDYLISGVMWWIRRRGLKRSKPGQRQEVEL